MQSSDWKVEGGDFFAGTVGLVLREPKDFRLREEE